MISGTNHRLCSYLELIVGFVAHNKLVKPKFDVNFTYKPVCNCSPMGQRTLSFYYFECERDEAGGNTPRPR